MPLRSVLRADGYRNTHILYIIHFAFARMVRIVCVCVCLCSPTNDPRTRQTVQFVHYILPLGVYETPEKLNALFKTCLDGKIVQNTTSGNPKCTGRQTNPA